MESESLVYTVEEIGQKLKISRPQVYLGLKRGEIPCIRVGHRVLIPKAAFDRLLSGQGNQPACPASA